VNEEAVNRSAIMIVEMPWPQPMSATVPPRLQPAGHAVQRGDPPVNQRRPVHRAV